MTSYIVDTHALVWFLEKNPRLSENAKLALTDTNAQSMTLLLQQQALFLKI